MYAATCQPETTHQCRSRSTHFTTNRLNVQMCSFRFVGKRIATSSYREVQMACHCLLGSQMPCSCVCIRGILEFGNLDAPQWPNVTKIICTNRKICFAHKKCLSNITHSSMGWQCCSPRVAMLLLYRYSKGISIANWWHLSHWYVNTEKLHKDVYEELIFGLVGVIPMESME